MPRSVLPQLGRHPRRDTLHVPAEGRGDDAGNLLGVANIRLTDHEAHVPGRFGGARLHLQVQLGEVAQRADGVDETLPRA